MDRPPFDECCTSGGKYLASRHMDRIFETIDQLPLRKPNCRYAKASLNEFRRSYDGISRCARSIPTPDFPQGEPRMAHFSVQFYPRADHETVEAPQPTAEITSTLDPGNDAGLAALETEAVALHATTPILDQLIDFYRSKNELVARGGQPRARGHKSKHESPAHAVVRLVRSAVIDPRIKAMQVASGRKRPCSHREGARCDVCESGGKGKAKRARLD